MPFCFSFWWHVVYFSFRLTKIGNQNHGAQLSHNLFLWLLNRISDWVPFGQIFLLLMQKKHYHIREQHVKPPQAASQVRATLRRERWLGSQREHKKTVLTIVNKIRFIPFFKMTNKSIIQLNKLPLHHSWERQCLYWSEKNK